MERYSELAIQNFVDSSAEIRWCPFPDCGYAICMRKNSKENSQDPEDDEIRSKEDRSKEDRSKEDRSKEGTSNGGDGGGSEGATALSGVWKMTPGVNVECGQGHGFCWECLKEPHEPCCCELWERWQAVTVRFGKGSSLEPVVVRGVQQLLFFVVFVLFCFVFSPN